MVGDRFNSFTTIAGDLVFHRAERRGLPGIFAGALGLASAILGGDWTSEAKAKRKRKQRRKRRRTRQCSGADDCSAPEEQCLTAICRRQRCRVRNRPDGTPCGDERECRDGVCEIPCDGLCTGGRICRDDACVCPESGECVISPSQLDGWSLPAGESVGFVVGPGEPPRGSGSVRLSTIDNRGSAIGNDLFDGVPIAAISALGFATYVETGSSAADGVPSLEFTILSGEGAGLGDSSLVFEPAKTANASILPDVWQTWDALNADAMWFVEDGPEGCEDGCLMSWAEVLAAFPGANIVGLLVIRSGIGASDVAGHLDALTINGLTYDFEPDAP